MKSSAKRLGDIKSLRELRQVLRENEAAKHVACERVKSVSLKIISLSDVMLLFVERYAPANLKRFAGMIFGADK